MNYLLDSVPTTSNQPVNEDEDNLSESESESETDHFTMTVLQKTQLCHCKNSIVLAWW